MELTLPIILLALGVGLVAGITAGFVGVGGGIVMVPVLLELFRRWGIPDTVLVQAAMATSLTAAVFSVASATFRHHKNQRILWSLVPMLAPATFVGGLVAGRLAIHLPGRVLELGLAAVLLFSALRMLTMVSYDETRHPVIRWWKSTLVGLGTGLVAGLSGLAGGVVLVPALSLILRIPAGWLAGTSSATIIFGALAAALGYITATAPVELGDGFVGLACLPLSACLAVASIPGAQLGAWLNRRVGSRVFRRVFAVLILAVVVRLFL